MLLLPSLFIGLRLGMSATFSAAAADTKLTTWRETMPTARRATRHAPCSYVVNALVVTLRFVLRVLPSLLKLKVCLCRIAATVAYSGNKEPVRLSVSSSATCRAFITGAPLADVRCLSPSHTLSVFIQDSPCWVLCLVFLPLLYSVH